MRRPRPAFHALLLLCGGLAALAQQAPPPPPEAPPATPAPHPALRVVVIDPAHGGADAGARGPSGLLEKDLVLAFARALRSELQRQGLHVVLTREGDENPSFDDRAALANAQRGAVFLSLHVSSSGRFGTARAYYFGGVKSSLAKLTEPAPAEGLPRLRWEEAQEPYLGWSRGLAELLQVQLAQRFRGSGVAPAPGAVRQLRLVTAPAIAVEISSVSAPEPDALEKLAPGLADAVARAVTAFRSVYQAGEH